MKQTPQTFDDAWFQVESAAGDYMMFLPQHSDDHIQKGIAASGKPYELEMLNDMASRLRPGDHVTDIGANIGNHTIFLAKLGAVVSAYEANTALTEALKQSVERNGFNETVSVRSTALGSEPGIATFSTEIPGNLGAQKLETGSGEIQVKRLDDEDLSSPIKVMKIDVEGMEIDVLEGAKNRINSDRPAIYIEASTSDEFEALVSWFEKVNYGFCATFNATPTHLFVPEETMSPEEKIVQLRQSCAKSVYTYYGYWNRSTLRLTEQNSKLAEQRSKLTEQSSKLAEQNSKLAEQSSKLAEQSSKLAEQSSKLAEQSSKLAKQKEQNEKSLSQVENLRKAIQNQLKKQKKLEKYQRILLICALPVLLLLLPVLLPYAIYRRIRKIRRRQITDNSVVAKQSEPSHPKGVNIPHGDPLSVLKFLGEQNRPWVQRNVFPELISVLIPSFNNAEYLESAIKSAIFQVGVNVEVIVIDDGSSDDSLEIAARLARQHRNLKVVPLLRNFGCYYARNTGLSEATGDYVTIVDSDDIMHPSRLFQQLSWLKSQPNAIACQSQARRWTEDYSKGLFGVKIVENTLLFPRSVVEEIGYYDCVRFAGDSEFRERMQSLYGKESVTALKQELYYLRTTSDSLTLQPGSAAYDSESDQKSGKLSRERSLYVSGFRNWHKQCQQDKTPPYIGFPLLSRPFELGSSKQNASPSLGEDIVGGLATFPERLNTLKATLPSILSQVDRLHVYLNGYDHIPEFLNHPRVSATLGVTAQGDLRDNGKFFSLSDEKGYIFTFDDDIIYPSDYTAKMVQYIEKFDRKAVVGIHGVIFPPKKLDYMTDRTVYHFAKECGGHIVDLLGTGTTAYHSTTISLSMDDFKSKGICDLWFACVAHSQKVPLLSVPRTSGWLSEIKADKKATRLYDEAKAGGGEHTRLYHQYLWSTLEQDTPRKFASAGFEKRLGKDSLKLAGFEL